jgi:hypothetical protein
VCRPAAKNAPNSLFAITLKTGGEELTRSRMSSFASPKEFDAVVNDVITPSEGIVYVGGPAVETCTSPVIDAQFVGVAVCPTPPPSPLVPFPSCIPPFGHWGSEGMSRRRALI